MGVCKWLKENQYVVSVKDWEVNFRASVKEENLY
jgi:hypothetical protein